MKERIVGASDSYLSQPGYGYDYVVAVSQESINATALAFLNARQPVVNVCFVQDDDGHPQLIDHNALIAKAKGADPFRMPDSGPERDQAIKNLDDADFMYGFSAAMGLPAGFPVSGLPDIVTLGATATDHVVYRLLCRTFQLVNLLQVRHKTPVWESWAQPIGPSGQPWLFTYEVPLISPPVTDTKAFIDSPAFANLPVGTQQKVAAQPEDFTIKHLLFDFANASQQTRPEISGTVDPELLEKLYAHFSIAYFAQLQGVAMPLVAIVPAGSDPFAGLQTEFSISPCPADSRATTLNYLCAAAANPLPAAKPFTWSWVEPNQLDAFDGVCVLNRTHLTKHLEDQLSPYVEANKWLPQPVYMYVETGGWDAGYGVVRRSYTWDTKDHKPPENLKIDTETLDRPASGADLLHWKFHTSRELDLGWGNWLRGETFLELTVGCHGNVVTVTQQVIVNCLMSLRTIHYPAKLIDITQVDDITLAVAHDGTLATSSASHQKDDSDTIGYSWLVPGLQQRFEEIQADVRAKITKVLLEVPLSVADRVIFPGGKGFLFKDVSFSDHQDLVAHITYADPS